MALYHKWDVKNDFAYVLQFFSLISDGLVSVRMIGIPTAFRPKFHYRLTSPIIKIKKNITLCPIKPCNKVLPLFAHVVAFNDIP